MNIEHYLYTRGPEMDYGVFASPRNLTNSQLDIVESIHLSILGDDVFHNLKIPKWILYKDSDFLLWGICCENSLLASGQNITTHKGRPIRGFFGVVITDFDSYNLKLPFDINYFKELYKNETDAFWNQSESHYSTTHGFVNGDFKYVSADRNNYVAMLNTDIFKCKSLGEHDSKALIAAALTLDRVSLLIDNDNIEQATSRKGAFMNCVSPFVDPGLHIVRRQCPKCKRFVTSFTEHGICQECQYHEDVRPNINKHIDVDMDKQVKRDLEEAINKIAELESQVEFNINKLKKKNRIISLLSLLSAVLFIGLLFSQKSFSLKIFEDEPTKQELPSINYDIDNDINGKNDDNDDFSVELTEDIISVGAKVNYNFPIKIKSNTEDYTVTPQFEWIRVLNKSKERFVIEILANPTTENRECLITVKCNEECMDSVLIRQKSINN